jgi:hypothetical protein
MTAFGAPRMDRLPPAKSAVSLKLDSDDEFDALARCYGPQRFVRPRLSQRDCVVDRAGKPYVPLGFRGGILGRRATPSPRRPALSTLQAICQSLDLTLADGQVHSSTVQS